MNRLDVTEKIIAAKVSKGLKWSDVARKVGLSKEWVTAACLGQMTLNARQADVVAELFGLSADEKRWLTVVPYKGSLPTTVPTDPLIYRFYEIVNVYGTTLKELIHEEFGDGIRGSGRYLDLGQVPAVQDLLKDQRRSLAAAMSATRVSISTGSSDAARATS